MSDYAIRVLIIIFQAAVSVCFALRLDEENHMAKACLLHLVLQIETKFVKKILPTYAIFGG